MRTRTILRAAGAAIFAAASMLSLTTSASAFVGLSDKQQAHIEEYIHCKILLLTDLAAFEAEQPPCGGTPAVETKSLIPTGSAVYHDKREIPDCEQPTGSISLLAEIIECPVYK